jgi:hypothetical protein
MDEQRPENAIPRDYADKVEAPEPAEVEGPIPPEIPQGIGMHPDSPFKLPTPADTDLTADDLVEPGMEAPPPEPSQPPPQPGPQYQRIPGPPPQAASPQDPLFNTFADTGIQVVPQAPEPPSTPGGDLGGDGASQLVGIVTEIRDLLQEISDKLDEQQAGTYGP